MSDVEVMQNGRQTRIFNRGPSAVYVGTGVRHHRHLKQASSLDVTGAFRLNPGCFLHLATDAELLVSPA
jgi:hypothetical protein